MMTMIKDAIKFLQEQRVPYLIRSNCIKITENNISAIIHYSTIGGIYAILYTDIVLLEHIQAVKLCDYIIELQGITNVDRLAWLIRSKTAKPNILNIECIKFICSLSKSKLVSTRP
jgi:hypothetical protein